MRNLSVVQSRIGSDIAQTASARDLHAALGVRKDFSNWIKSQLSDLFTQGVDFEVFPMAADTPELCSPFRASKARGGSNRVEYVLTIDCAKHIALMSRTDAGKRIRDYFIAFEKGSHHIHVADPKALQELQEASERVLAARQAFLRAKDSEHAAAAARKVAQTELMIETSRFDTAICRHTNAVARNLERMRDTLGDNEAYEALVAELRANQ